ncbi:low molecular weight protein-tyrosine-phosphatase [Porphyromonas sp. COT-239 OH1446]|uniref:low molecular weight protein-tyrosine-phosphatase n=1 Tax=Porphyromonas sp. COT-239 OH1446 TaxID=1515613 RepID=UPI00052D3775|nr:low molecular weight protein-tyrosine-phosphatase [Porphyromonas sp. COT-239 OH1446]KGN71710.1 phosphotyrosine protein phosphatase [Porphyromonas sp. COT-239 OH1446]
MQQTKTKTKILFVCLGNICRSPSAEGVFSAYVAQEGLSELFEIDSAGTSAHHEGEPADSRMRAHAARRGYTLSSLSRPVVYEDFFRFDYIIGMDERNRQSLIDMAPTPEAEAKVSLLTDWMPRPRPDHVPDPYYGGAEGFERVLDILEMACPSLLEGLRQGLSPRRP